MSLIQWRDEYATGVASVDHEHKELIGVLNETAEKIAPGCDADEVRDHLVEIHERISSHFALEEKVMLDRAYPKFSDHKNDHDRLLDEIGDILEDVDLNEALAAQKELVLRLDRWFSVHFATFDKELHVLAGL